MKLLIQRVTKAVARDRWVTQDPNAPTGSELKNTEIDDKKTHFSIKHGLLVLVGIGPADDRLILEKAAKKLIQMRIFEDETGKMKRAVSDIDGEIALVSQFTLYASLEKGNRPDFLKAAAPQQAKSLYENFIQIVGQKHAKTVFSNFGSDLDLEIHNQGPVTIALEW